MLAAVIESVDDNIEEKEAEKEFKDDYKDEVKKEFKSASNNINGISRAIAGTSNNINEKWADLDEASGFAQIWV